MFTRQHYKAIAGIIDKAMGPKSEAILLDVQRESMQIRMKFASDFADYFATDNPRFDRKKFLEACGL